MVTFGKDPLWGWDCLDHSRAAALLSEHLPNAARTGLEPCGSGEFCIAFRLEDQVIRVARHPEAAAALRREACVLATIEEMLPLPVPRPTYHSPPGYPPFTIHREIIGEILTREIWENMPGADRHKAGADLAYFLMRLHSLPVEPGIHCGLPRLDTTVVTRKLRQELTGTVDQFLDQKTRRQLDETLEQWSLPPESEEQRPALLHCDIGPGHVLYDPQTGKLTGVIDFGDLAIGDPARDFIYIYEDYGPMILNEVLDRYAGQAAPSMMFPIRKWYLLEAISWTVQMYREQRFPEMNHGIDEIRRELASLADR